MIGRRAMQGSFHAADLEDLPRTIAGSRGGQTQPLRKCVPKALAPRMGQSNVSTHAGSLATNSAPPWREPSARWSFSVPIRRRWIRHPSRRSPAASTESSPRPDSRVRIRRREPRGCALVLLQVRGLPAGRPAGRQSRGRRRHHCGNLRAGCTPPDRGRPLRRGGDPYPLAQPRQHA